MGDIRLARLHARRAALTMATAALPAWSHRERLFNLEPFNLEEEHMGQPAVHFEIGCKDREKTASQHGIPGHI